MEEIKEGYTRISEILKYYSDFSKIDPFVLKNKCRIGTNVHQIIQAESEGYFLQPREDEKGYVDSWRAWLESRGDFQKFCALESRFYCDEYKITGKVDAIASFYDRSPLILDYKTSAAPNKKIWAMQAAFYIYLAGKNGYMLEPYAWFVKLKKNGKKGTLYLFPLEKEIWDRCKEALSLYRYFNP